MQTEEIELRWVGGVCVDVCVGRVSERASIFFFFYMGGKKREKWKMLAEVETGSMDRQ